MASEGNINPLLAVITYLLVDKSTSDYYQRLFVQVRGYFALRCDGGLQRLEVFQMTIIGDATDIKIRKIYPLFERVGKIDF